MDRENLAEMKQEAMYSVAAFGVAAMPYFFGGSDTCISWTGLCGVSGIV